MHCASYADVAPVSAGMNLKEVPQITFLRKWYIKINWARSH
jgi:hypothetical protein